MWFVLRGQRESLFATYSNKQNTTYETIVAGWQIGDSIQTAVSGHNVWVLRDDSELVA